MTSTYITNRHFAKQKEILGTGVTDDGHDLSGNGRKPGNQLHYPVSPRGI